MTQPTSNQNTGSYWRMTRWLVKNIFAAFSFYAKGKTTMNYVWKFNQKYWNIKRGENPISYRTKAAAASIN